MGGGRAPVQQAGGRQQQAARADADHPLSPGRAAPDEAQQRLVAHGRVDPFTTCKQQRVTQWAARQPLRDPGHAR
jgi:hypothetical protein